MTPQDIRKARLRFGLSLAKMGRMLGFEGGHVAQSMHCLELPVDDDRHRPITKPRKMLLEIYLSGYRPANWPSRAPLRPRQRA